MDLKNKNNSSSISEFYFSDSRLRMTVVGRSLVRIFSSIFILFTVVAVFTLLISGITWLWYLAFIVIIFLIDYFIHRNEGRRFLSEIPIKGRVNLADYLKLSVFRTIEKAFTGASVGGGDFYLEIFKKLLGHKGIQEGLTRMNVSNDEILDKVDEFIKNRVVESGHVSKANVSGQVEALVKVAFDHALRNGHLFIECGDLFAALASMKSEPINRIFSIFGIEANDLEQALVFSSVRDRFSSLKNIPATIGGFIGGTTKIRHRIMNRAWTSRPTPTLDRFGTDFTDLARQEEVGFLIGHEVEYQRMVDALARPVNPNALLIGEAGIGKETMVAHFAYDLVKDKVPEALFDKRLVMLDIAGLVAGAAPEELQARLREIVEEIATAGNIILYIPDMHNLVKTSGAAYLSAADALMPVIMSNSFPVIGATYPREFKEFLESRSDLAGAFEKIRVNEISEEEAGKILIYESLILERQSKILISFGAIKKAVKLAKKYFGNKFLPSSASELIKDALVEARRKGLKAIQPDLVIEVAEKKTKIPIHEATEKEAEQLLNLEEVIHERLIDQEEAVTAVANVLREYRSGLAKPGGPIAIFLFVGPTGVGKTELAKILATIQFGSKDAMIRFDMTEYQDKQSFFRLIGSPDGKVSGSLTEAVLEKPYSLILLDEFEKAFPDILNLFLQVFDDGRLTDNNGRLVDFQNTIIIATSNAHSDIINEALRQGQVMSQIGEYLKTKLTDVFKPELLNRFSKIVVFNNLSAENLYKVTLLNLKDFAKTLDDKGIVLEFSEEVVKKISKLGFEPAFGARPLQRVIAERLKAPLAQKMLNKEVVRGGRYTVVLKGEEEFNFVAAE
ncbi:MAG: ATP-dependent Clp protease ATP-binding subunit [Candidatus Paceibacterota bacterium]